MGKIYIKKNDTKEVLQELKGVISQVSVYDNSFLKLIYKHDKIVKCVCIPLSDNIYITIDENG